MKLLRNAKNTVFQEIEVEYSFLFFKWMARYRKAGGYIMRYKSPNTYIDISLSEYLRIRPLFEFPVTN